MNKQFGIFKEIRGRGLMIGAELNPQWHGKAGDISELGRKHGVLVLQAGPNVLRCVPPLTITEKEMKEGIARLQQAITVFLSQ
jgi:acetylornithine/N-succinyldiaminopimelate aminotransferase